MTIKRMKMIPCHCEGTLPYCDTCGGSGRLNAKHNQAIAEEIDHIEQLVALQPAPNVKANDKHLIYSIVKQFLGNMNITVKMENKTYKITFTTI
ncbi:hypothetical protein WAK64_06215 [Bacillus spongiae]|uniref:Uncharacterized protein n=1 Tax=Bacillus spongiae TaxID=2683610 RepID=A0ABU8HBK8_9BACI